MSDEYKSMREIGKEFGATSHEVGEWLKNLGLRTPAGKPAPEAFSEEWVRKAAIEWSGGYFFTWNVKRVCELFRQMGYKGKRGVQRSPE